MRSHQENDHFLDQGSAPQAKSGQATDLCKRGFIGTQLRLLTYELSMTAFCTVTTVLSSFERDLKYLPGSPLWKKFANSFPRLGRLEGFLMSHMCLPFLVF